VTADLPILSIVVAARNDAHGGDFLRRMQIFVTGLWEQASKHRFHCELVIVEWNPPADRPRLIEALKWPERGEPMAVRIIEVPTELHEKVRHSDKLQLFQMMAKNVGIRRARAPFILVTNVDVLFSDELMKFLASGNLKSRRMYRIDRYDASADIPINTSVEEQLDFCRKHVLRVNTRYGTFKEDRIPREEPRFLLLIPTRLYALMPHVWHLLSFLVAKLSSHPHGVKGVGSPGTISAEWLRSLRRHFQPLHLPLHMQTPGDFTLLSKEDWFALRGYPEFEMSHGMYSAYIDSLLCVIAHRDGIVEEVLQDPMRIYHIEHTEGRVSPWQFKDYARQLGVPMIDSSQFKSIVTRLYKEKRRVIFNSEAWGLGFVNLYEKSIYAD
jgi:hypothetical protein